MFYPVWIDPDNDSLVYAGKWIPLNEEPDLEAKDGNLIAVWPIRKDLSLGRWGISSDTLNNLIENGYAKLGRFDRKRSTWGISYLSEQVREDIDKGLLRVLERDSRTGVADVAYINPSSKRTKTTWHRSSHDAGAHGTDLLKGFIPGRQFPKPKSLYAVEDTLRIAVGNKPNAIILDFFSGSGTTCHAVMRLNKQDGGRRQCISVTNNEVSADEQKALRKKGLRPGDPDWEALGICDYVTKPRIEAAITGKTPEGKPIKGDYKFTDEFPIADGFEENVEFFTLTYEAPRPVAHHRSFEAIAPLLWLRAGAQGRRIDKPLEGFDVAETYGVLFDLDTAEDYLSGLNAAPSVRMAFIVTDDDRGFAAVCRDLPAEVEAVRLYASYLTNFTINTGRD
ncbi:DNA methyltransferase [Wenzhouxiangella sp. EGI_FJ10305]|uniref:DNA methyltransferase n=1 Tax=Wenzhouxiangella sp. EGI_FJ10305 TaxID=3243768 RepID=UPI0035D9B353